jgi:hypothetical protein
MHTFTKLQRRRLRDLADIAYEREVKLSLEPLAASFEDWRMGKISSLALSSLVHEYDYGMSRSLWGKYQSRYYDVIIAAAVAKGILSEQEVGADIIQVLSSTIQFMKQDMIEDSSGNHGPAA